MKPHFVTLFLLIGLFVAAAPSGLSACGSGKSKSCCSKTVKQSASDCAADAHNCAQDHPGQKCPDSKGCGGCPCGSAASACSGGLIIESPFELSSLLTAGDAILRQAFYFAQHIPEPVYLPIWQPPQLAA
jgi:hypothetical protein